MVLFRATISGGGGGISESTDGWGCAILALEVIPKNILPKNLFYKILHLLFQQGKLCLTNISSKNGQYPMAGCKNQLIMKYCSKFLVYSICQNIFIT